MNGKFSFRIMTIFMLLFAAAGGSEVNESCLFDWVILHSVHGGWNSENGWDIRKHEVEVLLPLVQDFVKANSEDFFKRLDSYACQVYGFVSQGNRRLFFNFFQKSHHKDWMTKPVFVKDGGDSYFQLEYDVDSGKCLNFHVNGES